MCKKYMKSIDLSALTKDEISKFEGVIQRLGYGYFADYRIVEFGHAGVEMKIMNKELHRDLRTIRKTVHYMKKKR